eukprot:TRINITY_DN8152_c0_g1_i1.p1 TRINITY_DN8152_c0_g1~~TRINITY_DN8152_c0_g1_i1.p1  ORF type:complete len:451 (-),score=58.84 TRINITY_DN8152_c0_g1_i1:254-1606(-)
MARRSYPDAYDIQQSAIRRHGPNVSVLAYYGEAPRFIQARIEQLVVSRLDARVFYLAGILAPHDIPRLLTDVPQIAINGDQHIRLQNSKHFTSTSPIDYQVRVGENVLITYTERRRSRKKVIASMSNVYAFGGYPAKTRIVEYSEPIQCVIITAAGAQFEFEHLEWRDFIIAPGQPADMRPLFAHYYPHTNGVIPSFADVHQCMGGAPLTPLALAALRLPRGSDTTSAPTATTTAGPAPVATYGRPLSTADYLDVGRPGAPVYLNVAAYRCSAVEDVRLILTAFSHMVAVDRAQRRGWFKLTAIGLGFFASHPAFNNSSIGQKLAPLLLQAIEIVLSSDCLPRPRGGEPYLAVLELPDFMKGGFTPAWGDIKGVRVVKGYSRDVLLFEPEELAGYVCGALNAGDCFCIPGNETGYMSVEAAIGNNSDVRIAQAYYHNRQLLDVSTYIAVR